MTVNDGGKPVLEFTPLFSAEDKSIVSGFPLFSVFISGSCAIAVCFLADSKLIEHGLLMDDFLTALKEIFAGRVEVERRPEHRGWNIYVTLDFMKESPDGISLPCLAIAR